MAMPAGVPDNEMSRDRYLDSVPSPATTAKVALWIRAVMIHAWKSLLPSLSPPSPRECLQILILMNVTS